MSVEEGKILPEDFRPGANDVIVGRGKVCYKHSGNQLLIKIVQGLLKTYSASDSTKKSKSELIKSIMAQVRDGSPDGGFVKFDSELNRWYEVGDRIAREKVSQTFRDALNDQYKSSTTSKTMKRRQERINSQSSIGPKDSFGSPSARKPGDSSSTEEPLTPHKRGSENAIGAAQARVDSLIRAAAATAPPMLSPGAMGRHPHQTPYGMPSPYLNLNAFGSIRPGLAAMPHPGLGNAARAYMTPSLASLMAAHPGAAVTQPSLHNMLLNREIEYQQRMRQLLTRPPAATGGTVPSGVTTADDNGASSSSEKNDKAEKANKPDP